MKLRQQSSTSYPITFLMVDSADHVTGKTGLTPTVTISKNGAAFGSPAGAVSEIGSGWYALAGNATDRGTLGDLLVHAESTGADPVDDRYCIVPWDPFDAAALGLTRIDVALSTLATAAALATVDGIVDDILVDTGTTLPALIDALPTAAEAAAQVRVELATELAHLDEDVSSRAAAGDAMALVDDAITAAKYDQSTAHPLAQADTGSTAVARTGADDDTLETLSDEIAGISAGSGLTAQQTRDAMKLAPSAGAPAAGSVDAHLDDILSDTALIEEIKAITDALDVTAVTQVAANASGALTITRTLDFAATVSGLTIPADWEACYWTVKRSTDDPDADALVQILESNPGDADDGVQILMGEALTDESDGSLTVNQALGTVTIALGNESTALLEDAVELVWDVKVRNPDGKTQPGAGTATITTAVTRA